MPTPTNTDYDNRPGLGTDPKERWPAVAPAEAAMKPIDRLIPKSLLHTRVLGYVKDRLESSEHAMNKFYARWQCSEKRMQAYIDLPDWELQLKNMNDASKPPQIVSIVVPYSYSIIFTICTYLLHTFAGRSPMFQIGTNKQESVNAARMMELVLQYNCDHSRMVALLWQFCQDTNIYGVGVLRTAWQNQRKMRTVRRKQPRMGLNSMVIGEDLVTTRELRTVYQGNAIYSQDPFLFFPDPRVPMHQVAEKGEFCFWRDFIGKHQLKSMEADGIFKWIDATPQQMPTPTRTADGESFRNLITGGETIPSRWGDSYRLSQNFYQIDQGTVEIIPAELGLGTSTRVEKWIFTIANKAQIIQCEPFGADHDKHPVAVSEPYAMGYGFGQPGMTDFINPLQDGLSWFMNSHIENVKRVMNNKLIVDPSMVEMQDLRDPDARLVRLKRASYGQDVKTAVYQLALQDVTAGHIGDMEMLTKIVERLSAVGDNLMGLQENGGRKSATEARQSAEAGASRLAALARIISAQALVSLTEQMTLNIQQYMEEEFYTTLTGADGQRDSIFISPEMLVGDFNFPVHDGTLPLDRVAMLDVWKEIMLGVGSDPQLRTTYDITKIFEHVAELGGVKNIESFRLQVAPDQMVAQQAQAGNVIPLPQPGAPTPGVQPNPGARMAGGL